MACFGGYRNRIDVELIAGCFVSHAGVIHVEMFFRCIDESLSQVVQVAAVITYNYADDMLVKVIYGNDAVVIAVLAFFLFYEFYHHFSEVLKCVVRSCEVLAAFVVHCLHNQGRNERRISFDGFSQGIFHKGNRDW